MIKCAVCGSENEAAALFCGTCGSPLSPAEAKTIAEDATAKVEIEAPTPDEAVVPGKGGARRDLGTGSGTQPVEVPPGGGVATEAVITDSDLPPSGSTVVCSVCGTVNDAARTYCRKCANELKPAAAPAPPPPPPPSRRGLSPITIGLGAAAAVVAIALVGVILFGNSGLPTTSQSPSGQPTTGPSQSAGVEPTPGETTTPSPTDRVFTEGDTPEGQIAFARCPAGGGPCVIFMRPADASEKAVRIIGAPSGSAQDPAISHDGTRIIYSVPGGLNIVDIESREFEAHSNVSRDLNASWSWDDSQITFSGRRPSDDEPTDDPEIRIDGITVNGSSTPLTINDLADLDPVFTPDDASIIWVQGNSDALELKQIIIETGEVIDLTNDDFDDLDPAISPDGTELAFVSKRESDEYDLFLMNLATKVVTPLSTMEGNEHDPAWSPGGRYIVFSAGEEGQKDLFIFDLKTMSTKTFTTTSADSDIHPSWQ